MQRSHCGEGSRHDRPNVCAGGRGVHLRGIEGNFGAPRGGGAGIAWHYRLQAMRMKLGIGKMAGAHRSQQDGTGVRHVAFSASCRSGALSIFDELWRGGGGGGCMLFSTA